LGFELLVVALKDISPYLVFIPATQILRNHHAAQNLRPPQMSSHCTAGKNTYSQIIALHTTIALRKIIVLPDGAYFIFLQKFAKLSLFCFWLKNFSHTRKLSHSTKTTKWWYQSFRHLTRIISIL
jgi:hypothetical protein